MISVAAVWHNPGGPNGAGRGDYPVVILGFDSLRAMAVDTAGRLWAIPTDQLMVRDHEVLAKLTAAAAQMTGAPG
jgi:hypothetical protein